MSQTRVHSRFRVVVPAALVLALAASPAVAAHRADQARSSHRQVLRFVATDEPGNLTVEDLGTPSRNGRPGQGDVIAFTQDLRQHGRVVGTVSVTAIGADARRHLSEATGTLRLGRGTVQVAGLVPQSPAFTLAVTGGTGRYAGARGVLAFAVSGGRQTLTVRLHAGR